MGAGSTRDDNEGQLVIARVALRTRLIGSEPMSLPIGDQYLRSIVSIQVALADPPEDFVSHTVWHHWTNVTGETSFDYDGHATNVANVFQHGTNDPVHGFFFYQQRKIHVKTYSMNDMKPRPILGEHTLTPTTWSSSALGPREIAVPMRYYATRNLKHLRGRLFIGPFANSLLTETVDQTAIARRTLDLAEALAAIGGVNTSWCMHSESQDVLNGPGSPGGTTTAAWHDITHAWCNDQWAHMESRQHVELARTNMDITPGIP